MGWVWRGVLGDAYLPTFHNFVILASSFRGDIGVPGLFCGRTGLLIILLGPLEAESSRKIAECCFTILAGGL